MAHAETRPLGDRGAEGKGLPPAADAADAADAVSALTPRPSPQKNSRPTPNHTTTPTQQHNSAPERYRWESS
jgi:hypothetical protein